MHKNGCDGLPAGAMDAQEVMTAWAMWIKNKSKKRSSWKAKKIDLIENQKKLVEKKDCQEKKEKYKNFTKLYKKICSIN